MMSGFEMNADSPSTVPQRKRDHTKLPASVSRNAILNGNPIHAPMNVLMIREVDDAEQRER